MKSHHRHEDVVRRRRYQRRTARAELATILALPVVVATLVVTIVFGSLQLRTPASSPDVVCTTVVVVAQPPAVAPARKEVGAPPPLTTCTSNNPAPRTPESIVSDRRQGAANMGSRIPRAAPSGVPGREPRGNNEPRDGAFGRSRAPTPPDCESGVGSPKLTPHRRLGRACRPGRPPW